MMDITAQQREAIESSGKVIVSASAGSGKTFVMIQKLVAAIESGVDLDSVLAVTFTKKAAAQMKEKLRGALIGAMAGADKDKRNSLKIQLSKIQSADISTIHSFCARLLRTYFYAVGIDGTFDIISSDDSQAREYKERVISSMFEKYYEEDNGNFKTLLACYRRKRGDNYLKGLILSSYEELRINADYITLLDGAENLYTEGGFDEVCKQLNASADDKYTRLLGEVRKFAADFYHPNPAYKKILEEMTAALQNSIGGDIFTPQCPISVTRKPSDKTEDEKELGERFKKFKDGINTRYKAVRGDICDRQIEKERFFASGIVAKAFAEVLKDFDREYTELKRDENKLDYNDLEHLTLKLLKDEEIRREVNSKYSCVFVDEYQDVNPVQEEIISNIGGENVFLVGDVKQAIYGFRGSKSLFFAEKYNRFEGGGGSALRLSNNFRSSDGVLAFVNKLFSKVMTEESCGFEYSDGSEMIRGGGYPVKYGSARIHIFGKEEDGEEELEVYSVRDGVAEVKHSREALAVLSIVEDELKSQHYDLKSGGMVDTQPGDICILTRKRNRAAEAIVRALEDAGYSVTGAQGVDITSRPEVRQILDILSYIDNKQQDIPLATSLLSPLGGLSCDELAAIRVACKGRGRTPFRECCRLYIKYYNNEIAQKLRSFRVKIESLRDLAEVLTAAEMIDRILEDTYLEAEYSGGEKLKNIRRLAQEGENISVSSLLAKLKSGYEITAPTSAASDSIKIMTMHASKGLEFPVVIISDICATFKGKDSSELPLDEKFGFAPKCFDTKKKLTDETILRKLIKERTSREELKNELNLFYVACTRAMCNLHILAEDKPEFNAAQVSEATAYSKLFDLSLFNPEEIEVHEGEKKEERTTLIAQPDNKLYERINSRFARTYAAAESVNLPVKSSASAILKMGEEDTVCTQLFGGEGETGTERGIAYHRFLELCDFNIKDRQGVAEEKESFLKAGLISGEQYELLDTDTLTEIVNIPIFSTLGGATLYREQEFLCLLPANGIMDTTACDDVLIQGAIDLLAKTDKGYKIIDYKYSHKTEEQLKETYSKQLALYKKAVATITKTDERNIETIIVNIFRKEQIDL